MHSVDGLRLDDRRLVPGSAVRSRRAAFWLICFISHEVADTCVAAGAKKNRGL
jgi:hypothetical protein